LIICEPAARDEVVNVAIPELRLAVPRTEPPSRNVTVPVGVPEPGATGETWTVNVTACPPEEGFTDDEIAVVVPGSTTCVSEVEVLVAKFESPSYAAMSEWEPTLSELVVKLATPRLSVPVPMIVEPSKNSTCPVGVPLWEVTSAVNTTIALEYEGFNDEIRSVAVG
jgi:hypothetical protein